MVGFQGGVGLVAYKNRWGFVEAAYLQEAYLWLPREAEAGRGGSLCFTLVPIVLRVGYPADLLVCCVLREIFISLNFLTLLL